MLMEELGGTAGTRLLVGVMVGFDGLQASRDNFRLFETSGHENLRFGCGSQQLDGQVSRNRAYESGVPPPVAVR